MARRAQSGHSHHTPGMHRLRITNLPAHVAQDAPHSARWLAELIFTSTGISTHRQRAWWRWLSGDGSITWAFLDVDDEPTGNLLIASIHTVVIDGIPLQAEWSTDCRPMIWLNTSRITNPATPHPTHFYLRDRGLVLVHNNTTGMDIPLQLVSNPNPTHPHL